MTKNDLEMPITQYEYKFIPVDEWEPSPEDFIIKQCKDFIIAPVSRVFNTDNPSFDSFSVSIKRAYNIETYRLHYQKYINYFEKFYDTDYELISSYAVIKYMIDFEPTYNKNALMFDLRKYFFNNISMMYKINSMNNDNYSLNLSYKSKINPSLQYTMEHGRILMKMSLMFNILVPLLTHFMKVKKIINTTDFLLFIWDEILSLFDIDIYNKLYETSSTNVNRKVRYNPIWDMQDIRGINPNTHSLDTIVNILLNVAPKYEYSGNIICLNYSAIEKGTRYQVTDIAYDHDFIPLSSSKRDEDNNSEFDKFESSLTKQNEALYIQNKVNCEQTMEQLKRMYTISDEEIEFYKKELSKNGNNVINSFQKKLIFSLFYKYFGDTFSIKGINMDDYVRLMIMAKKILLANTKMFILPYIIGGRVVRLMVRKGPNKHEAMKLQASSNWANVLAKYKDQKIIDYILSLIGTCINSEFEFIDFDDKELNGRKIDILPDILSEEIAIFINLI